jgi:hypothetical protein
MCIRACLCHKGTRSLTQLLCHALLFLESPRSNVSDYHRDQLAWLLQHPQYRGDIAFWDISKDEPLLKGIVTTLSSETWSPLSFLADKPQCVVVFYLFCLGLCDAAELMFRWPWQNRTRVCPIEMSVRQWHPHPQPEKDDHCFMLYTDFLSPLKVNVGINLATTSSFLNRS